MTYEKPEYVEVYASQIMALVGNELVTHVSEPDALTTRPPPLLLDVIDAMIIQNSFRALYIS